jgi:hypothetical protein
MSAAFQYLETVVLEVAGPQFSAAHEHHANLVVKLGAEFPIPFAPAFNRVFS